MCSGGNAGLHVAMSGFLTPRPGLNELCDALLFTVETLKLSSAKVQGTYQLVSLTSKSKSDWTQGLD